MTKYSITENKVYDKLHSDRKIFPSECFQNYNVFLSFTVTFLTKIIL